ncbi:hypothetical protein AP3564_13910 [Aeribacillus pallidus]|uniref:Uncharacterized protein n=1 Tax=Aeribacillus pallidus TaxID=33936 RepID=A0A223E7C5_9BACI|nr:hypothetical protein AP3564_13910 [Aeribacillus pallidus]
MVMFLVMEHFTTFLNPFGFIRLHIFLIVSKENGKSLERKAKSIKSLNRKIQILLRSWLTVSSEARKFGICLRHMINFRFYFKHFLSTNPHLPDYKETLNLFVFWLMVLLSKRVEDLTANFSVIVIRRGIGNVHVNDNSPIQMPIGSGIAQEKSTIMDEIFLW